MPEYPTSWIEMAAAVRLAETNARARVLLEGLEEINARWPGHVRTLMGAERCDRLAAALQVPEASPTTAGGLSETVELYRLVDSGGDTVSAHDMDSDIYTSRDRAERDRADLAATYGPLTVQSTTVSITWSAS